MRCWTCQREVPLGAFCISCGAALPDGATRQRAIEERLVELSREREDLEGQLQRLSVVAPVGLSEGAVPLHLLPPPPAPPSVELGTRAGDAAAPQVRTTPANARFFGELSPATVVTFIGVVLLSAASFVGAKEHPALLSWSHVPRVLALVVELVLAFVATVKLSRAKVMLADAFGTLTWAAGLSLALLTTVNVDTGIRPDLWTYSIPFLVGAFTLGLARRLLKLTRLLGLGTMSFGVLHLAYFGVHPNVDGFNFASEVSMLRGAVVMALVSVLASVGLRRALRVTSPDRPQAEQFLAGTTIALLLIVALAAPLPDVTSTWSGILAFVALSSFALPLSVSANVLRERSEGVAVALKGLAGVLILLVLSTALLGHVHVITTFGGSHFATMVYPALMAGIALLSLLWSTRRRRSSLSGVIVGAGALIPSIGAVAATLRFELLGYLGSGGFSSFVEDSGQGWFGRGVSIADVPAFIVAISAGALPVGLLIMGRGAAVSSSLRRTLRHLAVLTGVIGALSVVMRFTDPSTSTQLFAAALLVAGLVAFLRSRFTSPAAPIDEWLPPVFLGGGLIASLSANAASNGGASWRSSWLTIAGLLIIALLGVLAAVRRPATWHGFTGASVVLPAVTGIWWCHPLPRTMWQVLLGGLAALAMFLGLTLRRDAATGKLSAVGAGLLAGAAFADLVQIASMIETGTERVHFAVLLFSVVGALAIGQRRGASLPTSALLIAAGVAGLSAAGPRHHDVTGLIWIFAGGAVLALLLMSWRRVVDSWGTVGPPLVYSFVGADVVVAGHPTTATLVLLAVVSGVVTVGGYLTATDAASQLGAGSLAVAIISHHEYQLAWIVAAVATALLLGIAAVQRTFPGRRLSSQTEMISLVVAGAIYLRAVERAVVSHHSGVAVVVVSIAVVYIAAALRLKAPLSTELVLGAGVVGGLVWSVGLHAVAAPGLWIAGCGLVILALGLGTDSEAHASWKEWGPALAFTMIPANSAALKGGSLSAAVAIGAAIALVVVGVQLKKRAVFDVAIATFVLLSAARLTQVVSDQGRWVVAVIIGVALIANGIWRETRRAGHERDASATSWYRSLT